MALCITAEIALFGTLLVSYFYYRLTSPTWPYGGIEQPHLIFGIILSIIVWSSSAPMWWADGSLRRGDAGAPRIGLALSFLLAAAFLALEAYDFASSDFGPTTNVYGSLWFTILGFHFAHTSSSPS